MAVWDPFVQPRPHPALSPFVRTNIGRIGRGFPEFCDCLGAARVLFPILVNSL